MRSREPGAAKRILGKNETVTQSNVSAPAAIFRHFFTSQRLVNVALWPLRLYSSLANNITHSKNHLMAICRHQLFSDPFFRRRFFGFSFVLSRWLMSSSLVAVRSLNYLLCLCAPFSLLGDHFSRDTRSSSPGQF